MRHIKSYKIFESGDVVCQTLRDIFQEIIDNDDSWDIKIWEEDDRTYIVIINPIVTWDLQTNCDDYIQLKDSISVVNHAISYMKDFNCEIFIANDSDPYWSQLYSSSNLVHFGAEVPIEISELADCEVRSEDFIRIEFKEK